MAILDCPTRWSSTHAMLERLLILKDFALDIAATSDEYNILSENDWSTAEKITSILEPAKFATLRLQTEQLTLSDFYGIWLRLIIDLGKISDPFSRLLVTKLKTREVNLKGHEIFNAALFLDPRFQFLLSGEDVSRAIAFLIQVWGRLKLLEGKQDGGENQNEEEDNASDDPVEIFLKSREAEKGTGGSSEVRTMRTILEGFKNVPRASSDSSVLKYWNDRKNSHAELSELAEIILSVPATQVTVERLFSSLRFIVSHLRASMKPDTVDDILVIRCNK